jgi:hypothetical protein
MLFCAGYVFGSTSDLFSNIKITDWLSSIGTLSAVIVALYATKLNINRDKPALKVRVKYINTKLAEGAEGNVLIEHQLFIRVMNVGLRPITLDSVTVKRPVGGMTGGKAKQFNVTNSDKDTNPRVEPGDFIELALPSYMFIGKDNKLMDCVFSVTDATEIEHIADKVDNMWLLKV